MFYLAIWGEVANVTVSYAKDKLVQKLVLINTHLLSVVCVCCCFYWLLVLIQVTSVVRTCEN